MYLTYVDYQNMGGTLDATTFNDLEFEACKIVDWYTFNRLKNETVIPDEVRHLVFRLIRIGYARMNAFAVGQTANGNDGMSGAVASQSNDGYSVSFNVLSASDAIDRASEETINLVQTYLQGVVNSLGHKLLYRGLYPNE